MEGKKINFISKKICAVFIGIIITTIMIKVLGVDFFLIELDCNISEYDIKINRLDELLLNIIYNNLKIILIIYVILELKHGEVYKNIIICVTTFIVIYILLNIINNCNSSSDIIGSMVVYLPKYLNVYIFIAVKEKIQPFIEGYRNVKRIREEMRPLLYIIIMTFGITFITGFIQSIFGVMLI